MTPSGGSSRFRAGETYALPREISRADARYWRRPVHAVFVAEDAERIVGTHYLRANTFEGESHIANCAYIAAADARRRMARAMYAHSPSRRASAAGAMQFNFVVSTNEAAAGPGRAAASPSCAPCPETMHPTRGPVDAYVMFGNCSSGKNENAGTSPA
jgi:hypothetical protein